MKSFLQFIFAVPISLMASIGMISAFSYILVFAPVIFFVYCLFEGTTNEIIASGAFMISPLFLPLLNTLMKQDKEKILGWAIGQIAGWAVLAGIYYRV